MRLLLREASQRESSPAESERLKRKSTDRFNGILFEKMNDEENGKWRPL
ncbi:hypothetical protein KP78_10570 [Jeotgalibacillus soli]|uniref:Uncharacterized protein n=1 Tax=Jeotgalibacillus soli TaxID=889306 RepID=A0A0C2S6E3_9BACL|nr:hypothetical protein KP78_10570 [Jeotgalibacillus soli]